MSNLHKVGKTEDTSHLGMERVKPEAKELERKVQSGRPVETQKHRIEKFVSLCMYMCTSQTHAPHEVSKVRGRYYVNVSSVHM